MIKGCIGIRMQRIILFVALLVLTSLLPAQEIINNPKKPLSSEVGRILKIEEMFRINDDSGEFFFQWASNLQIAEDGSIFLTDVDQFLKFAPDGKYLKNIYKKGQGPGEIQSSFFHYHLHGENIFVYDPMNTKMILMDLEGRLIGEFKLAERYVQFIGLWDDDFIFTKYSWPDSAERVGKLFDIPGKILLISKEGDIINECPGIPWKIFLHPNLGQRLPMLATCLSEDCKSYFISDPDQYMVSLFDLEKFKFIRKFRREYSRVRRPNRETPLRSSIKIPEIEYENDIVDLYNFMGNLWVETSTNDDKTGTLYDVFNILGQYIDSFWLDKGELITTHRDFLFIRELDVDGSIRIVKYHVVH